MTIIAALHRDRCVRTGTGLGQDLPVWRRRTHVRWTPDCCRTCAEPRTGNVCQSLTHAAQHDAPTDRAGRGLSKTSRWANKEPAACLHVKRAS